MGTLSLVPRPHPLHRRKGLVHEVQILGPDGSSMCTLGVMNIIIMLVPANAFHSIVRNRPKMWTSSTRSIPHVEGGAWRQTRVRLSAPPPPPPPQKKKKKKKKLYREVVEFNTGTCYIEFRFFLWQGAELSL